MTSTENATVPTATEPGNAEPRSAPLVRSRDDRWIAGVCGGLAAHLNVDVTLLRILMVVLAVVGNLITVALYLACWVIMPEESTPSEHPSHAAMSTQSGNSE